MTFITKNSVFGMHIIAATWTLCALLFSWDMHIPSFNGNIITKNNHPINLWIVAIQIRHIFTDTYVLYVQNEIITHFAILSHIIESISCTLLFAIMFPKYSDFGYICCMWLLLWYYVDM